MIRLASFRLGGSVQFVVAVWLVALVGCGSGSDPGADLDRLRERAPGIRTAVTGDRITRIYGKPVHFGATSAEAAAAAFVSEYAGLFGAASDDLVLQALGRDGTATRRLRLDPKTRKYAHALVRYRQVRGGVPVHAAELNLLLGNRDGFPVTLATSTLRPLGNFEATAPEMEIDAAASRAAAFGVRHPDPLTLFVPFTGLDDFETPQPVIWAGSATAPEAPRMAFRYIGVRRNPRAGGADERWEFVAESGTGRILFAAPRVAHADVPGRVLGGIPWETRNRLLESEPDDYPTILAGLVTSSRRVAASKQTGQGLAIDLLSLDDDDGDLANGTPQLQVICDGLGAHGIACSDLTSVDAVRCIDHEACDDGSWCNGTERCVAYECRAAELAACGPGLACVESERACHCSEDAACSDGDYCNGVETCVGGTCTAATASPCTPEQICVPLLEVCWECMPPEFGGDPEECSDGDWCNGAETCRLGVCEAAASPRCPSGQSCDPDLKRCSCVVDAVCDDGDFCNGAELCSSAGVCVAGSPPFCDDGLICNGVEVCRDGACRPGQPIECRAPEVCNEVSGRCGCVTDVDCSDGSWCNGDELCDAEGVCGPGDPRECPAGERCIEQTRDCRSEALGVPGRPVPTR